MNCLQCGGDVSEGGACPRCDPEMATIQVDADVTRSAPASGAPAGFAGTLQPGDAFGPRYRILRVLGRGGMGVVYQAWDQTLGVAVALKVIRPSPGMDPDDVEDAERRFKRELLLARQVTHRNVVRIHDLGDVGGTTYITMSFVEGEDLATTLRRKGKLPLARVIHIARQVAAGLSAAHDAGVVHRDLKPANIMTGLDDDALIMDFGIATPTRALQRTAPVSLSAAGLADGVTLANIVPTPGGTVLSERGAIIGTLEYMSPEQSRGLDVDHRSDIYSFGLILSELILGLRRTPAGTTPWEALTARISQPPQPLRAHDPSIPEAVDAVVTKCLQLDPAKRFATASAVVAALDALDAEGKPVVTTVGPRRVSARTLAAAGVVVAALIAGAWWFGRRIPPPVVAHPRVSVLIEDFKNSTDDPVFNGLIEQALAVGVEGAPFISAYPRRDAMQLATTLKGAPTLDDKVARLISDREGIDTLIGGDISANGGGYDLHVHVVHPPPPTEATSPPQTVLDWHATASRDKVLDTIGQASARIRDALGDTTAPSSGANETFTAASLESAKAYADAQQLQWAGRFDDAIAKYKQTITLDPQMGRAYAGLAAMYANLGRRQDAEVNYKEAMDRLDRMTDREKYRTRGSYFLFEREPKQAIEQFQALVDKFPADSAGAGNLAFAYFYERDMSKALELGRKASEMTPNNVIRKNNAALYAMYAGDFGTAERTARDVLKLNPQYTKAFVAIAISQLASGRVEEAQSTWAQLAAVGSPAARSFSSLGLVDLALNQGQLADARKLLDEAIAADRRLPATTLGAVRLAIRANLLAAERDKAGALRDARAALQDGKDHAVTFLAARAFVAAGDSEQALALAKTESASIERDPQIYGALLTGEAALAAGDARQALQSFEAAQRLADTWLGRYDLGRAYLAAGKFVEAASEFDACTKRRGEATAVFLDDLPTYRFMRAVSDDLTRAQQALKNAGR